jgi:hypothetical protein
MEEKASTRWPDCARRNSQADPFSGSLFVFRSRRGTSIRILVYDGQGFWLAQKRLSKGVRVVAERKGTRPAAGSAPGAVAVGCRQPGNGCRAGVAQSELNLVPQQNPYVLMPTSRCSTA